MNSPEQNSPTHILGKVNTLMREMTERGIPVVTPLHISHDAYKKNLGNRHIKEISQGGAKQALSGEILLSRSYTRCISVLVRDNLNGYALHLHVDANRGGLSQEQLSTLFFFPKGSLSVRIIRGSRAFNSAENIVSSLRTVRDDIIAVDSIDLSSDQRFAVTYDTLNDGVYVQIENESTVLMAKGLDLNLEAMIPEIFLLSTFFRANIANTFFG